MNEEIKKFIKKNTNLIEEDAWDDFYKEADWTPSDELSGNSIGQMTQMFFEAGIYPQNYTRGIPAYFLATSSIEVFNIPEGADSIGGFAFFKCSSLKSLSIPSSVKTIGMYACSQCAHLKELVFKGTQAQWRLVDKEVNWNDGLHTSEVQCSDGVVKLK